MSFQVRAITPADDTFLMCLYGDTREDELSQAGNLTPEQKAAFVEMQYLAQTRYFQDKYPNASFDLLLVGSTPIGRRYVDRQKEVINIIDLTLKPERRGNGIGTKIMNEIMEEAREKKLVITLYLQKTEKCWNLFERMGFRSIADDGVNFLMELDPQNCPG